MIEVLDLRSISPSGRKHASVFDFLLLALSQFKVAGQITLLERFFIGMPALFAWRYWILVMASLINAEKGSFNGH